MIYPKNVFEVAVKVLGWCMCQLSRIELHDREGVVLATLLRTRQGTYVDTASDATGTLHHATLFDLEGRAVAHDVNPLEIAPSWNTIALIACAHIQVKLDSCLCGWVRPYEPPPPPVEWTPGMLVNPYEDDDEDDEPGRTSMLADRCQVLEDQLRAKRAECDELRDRVADLERPRHKGR